MRNKALGTDQNAAAREYVRDLVTNRFGGNQSRAAEALGVSESLLSEFLKGSRGAGMKLLSGIKALTGRSVDAILAGGDEAPAAPAVGRWDEHPEWAAAVAEAKQQLPDEVPPYAWERAGRMVRTTPAEHIPWQAALYLARAWLATASELERRAASRAHYRTEMVASVADERPAAATKGAGGDKPRRPGG